MSSNVANRVLCGSVLKTFIYYLIPSTVGLVAITTASLVDAMFLGNMVGPDGLTTISLLMPYLTLMVAINLALAIGGAIRAGKYMGEANQAEASAIFSKSLICAVLINLSIAIASLWFEQQLFLFLKAPSEIHPMLNAYFDVIRWVLVVQLSTMVLYYFVRADGHPVMATCALIYGALLNIILDAWFVFYLNLGVAGAAYSTAIAQVVQLIILSYYFFSPSRMLTFSVRQSRWKEMLYVTYNGLSEFVNEISVGIMFLLLNWLLIDSLGTNGVAAFSINNYFIFLSIMLYYGVADTLHLLVSQNLGAQNYDRIRQFFKAALFSVAIIGLTLSLLFVFSQEFLFKWFVKDEATDVIALASHIGLLIWPLFLVNGLNIQISCYLTAIQKPAPSAIIAFTRSLVFPAFFLGLFFYLAERGLFLTSLNSQWSFLIALPVAEWSSFVVAIFIYLCVSSEKFKM